jgi:hypothetical protein
MSRDTSRWCLIFSLLLSFWWSLVKRASRIYLPVLPRYPLNAQEMTKVKTNIIRKRTWVWALSLHVYMVWCLAHSPCNSLLYMRRVWDIIPRCTCCHFTRRECKTLPHKSRSVSWWNSSSRCLLLDLIFWCSGAQEGNLWGMDIFHFQFPHSCTRISDSDRLRDK